MTWEPGDGIQKNTDDNFVNKVTELWGKKRPTNASEQALGPGEKGPGFQKSQSKVTVAMSLGTT